MQLTTIPIADIYADEDFNCRGRIAPIDVTELMESISKNGLLEPITVQPFKDHPPHKYRIIAGHRRFTACKLLKMENISCLVREELNEVQARSLNLVENLQRKDLTLMQEAYALQKLLATPGVIMSEVGKLIGKPYGWVQVRFYALKMPPEIQQEIEAGFINQEHIKDLYQLGNKEAMFEAVRGIKDRRLKGDTGRIKIITKRNEQKLDIFEKKARTPLEIRKMQDIIRENIGNNFGTRALAWAMGEISAKEFFVDIKEIADKMDVPFNPDVKTGT